MGIQGCMWRMDFYMPVSCGGGKYDFKGNGRISRRMRRRERLLHLLAIVVAIYPIC